MNPIYRTLTGEIECTMECGKLYVRTINFNVIPTERGAWMRRDTTAKQAETQWEVEGDTKTRYKGGCMFHCLTGERKSQWLDIGQSATIRRTIDALEADYSNAVEAEMADRPIVEPREEGRG